MRMPLRLLILALAFVTVGVAAAPQARLTGTLTYRERIALTPEAVAEVTLEDVSRADAQSTVVGRWRLANPGQVPIAFDLPYDVAAIDAGRRYALRARIFEGATLVFTTTQTTLVLTHGHPSKADLVLIRSMEPRSTEPRAFRPGDQAPAPRAAAPLPAHPLPSLPATFTGTLPCADCPGIRYHLNLLPDDAFFLRMTYLDRPGPPRDDMGSWTLSSDRTVLVLQGRDTAPMYFAAAAGVLKKLDADGLPIPGRAPSELRRASAYQRVDVRLPMRGVFVYMADAGLFTECTTGQRWPVAMEAANAELERGYGAQRPAPGAAVLVDVEGLLTERPRMEGPGTQPSLVVEKIVRWLPKESCSPRFAGAPLAGTYWRLTQLVGSAVPAATDSRREPSLVFEASDGTFSGSTGCNRLIGRYEIENAAMTLTAAGTLMACPGEVKTEAAFTAALKATRGYRITGRMLDLLDDKGARLARFEARAATGITVR
jgi:copper homeostasis protein (lipoprotein)